MFQIVHIYIQTDMISHPSLTPRSMTASICTGGWITFLRRMDGSEDFYRGWADYKSGFGDPDREFWLGLDNLHTITNTGQYSLRADMIDFNGDTYYAEYSLFLVGDEISKYLLTVDGFDASSTAEDSLMGTDPQSLANTKANGCRFSTYDSDNDNHATSNCAASNARGGWWYSACVMANPTGIYGGTGNNGWQGIYWYTINNSNSALKQIELKMKPA